MPRKRLSRKARVYRRLHQITNRLAWKYQRGVKVRRGPGAPWLWRLNCWLAEGWVDEWLEKAEVVVLPKGDPTTKEQRTQ